jgi:hypothetical protein
MLLPFSGSMDLRNVGIPPHGVTSPLGKSQNSYHDPQFSGHFLLLHSAMESVTESVSTRTFRVPRTADNVCGKAVIRERYVWVGEYLKGALSKRMSPVWRVMAQWERATEMRRGSLIPC